MSVDANASLYRRGILELLVGAVLISFSPVFVKIADVEPTMAGFYRCTIGGVFLLVIVIARRDTLWRGAVPMMLAFTAAVLFAADLTFWHRSIEYIGPGLSTIMGNFQVFALAAYGILIARERVGWRLLVSIPMALLGLFLLVGIEWDQLESGYRKGVWFGVATALMYASYVLVLRKAGMRKHRLSATANLCVISLCTGAIMGVEGAVQGESFHVPNARSWVAMIAYGVIPQALGWIVISRALVKVPASRAGLILLLQPTLAFIWDILFFARPTTSMDIVGAVIAVTAIYLGGSRRS